MERARPPARPGRRGPLTAGLVALGLALVAIGSSAGGQSADAAGQRVRRVVLSGDSVTESATLAPDAVHNQGLDGALLAALAKRGATATDGYLRAHGLSLNAGVAAVVVGSLHYDGAWAYAQTDGGPDGYASVTVKPGAAVSFPPGTPRIRVLYTGSPPLVYYHAKQVPLAADGTVSLPDARARVKLVNTGNLVFDGVIRYPASGISLDVLGHAAALTTDGLEPGEVAQLRLLKPNQTLILFGTVEEYEENNGGLTPHTAEVAFVNGLYQRAQIAEASGTCVSSPCPRPRHLAGDQAGFRAIAEKRERGLDGARTATSSRTPSDRPAGASGPG